LHDIGKLGVSSLILDKPGKLTDDEFKIMRRHPVNTRQILLRTGCFSHLADVASSHHERLDGRGYDRGVRWGGDANFMPILAATTVMPELIPVTYGKLRAELERELLGATTVSTLVVSPDREFALADANGRLPQVAASEGEPLWRAALREVHDRGAIDAELAGWAGAIRAGADPPVLLFRADFPAKGTASPTSRLVAIADLAPPLDEGGVAALDRLGAAETP
jgi:hypothetical protein